MNRTLRTLFIICIIFSGRQSVAQKFPDEMNLSPDEHRLVTGGVLPYKGFYSSDSIRVVNFQFSGSTYWTTLTNNFPTRTDLRAKITIDGVVYDSVGIRFKGNSSYSSIPNSEKKSFNISLDEWKPGQNVGGYNTIVFNNCFADPSFMREIIYEQQTSKHIASPKGNFVHLYINGLDWGIYDNIEQLNHDYEKEWFLTHTGALWRARNPLNSGAPQGHNGDSLASLWNFGTDTSFYELHYNLKSTNIPDPWHRLVTLIQVLDTIPASTVEDVLGNYLDIDAALWLLISENIFSDDDSYLYKARKDYYMYFDPVCGRITPLEMDGNDTYSIAKQNTSVFFNTNNPNFVLVNKLLNMPVLRQRFLAHMRTAVKDELDTTECFNIIDSYFPMIDSAVQADPKKLYTYADFVSSQSELKSFITNRRSSILANSEVAEVPPVISSVSFSSNNVVWKRPEPGEDVWIKANVSCAEGINRVSLYDGINLAGKFSKDTMYDDGLHNDVVAGDGIFGAKITGKPGATWVRFYIAAESNNASNTVAYNPDGAEHNVYTYLVLPTRASDTSVVINELMAKNTHTAMDSAGDFEDWIELYNNSNVAKDISGYYLTDKKYNLIKWSLPPGTIIPAHGYQIIWADESKYEGIFNTNYNLSSTHGENLLLLNSNVELVDEVTFGPQAADVGYARVPNGTGSFVNQLPTFDASNSPPDAMINVSDTVCSVTVTFGNNSTYCNTYSWNFGDGTLGSTKFSPKHTYSSPGNYTVKLIAGDGIISDSDSVNIVVFDDPAVDFTYDTIYATTTSYNLDAGPGFQSYHWSTNETTQVITVNFEGKYCVDVPANHNCTNQTCVYVYLNVVGVREQEKKDVMIFPNPVDGFLEYVTDHAEKFPVEVRNSIGEIVFRKNTSENFLLNTRSWPQGVYIFRSGTFSKSFVVAH